MLQLKCHLIKNDCYKRYEKMRKGQPEGIVVHSTGANNPNLKRYVQPVKEQANYDTLMKQIGINAYGNHWNNGSTVLGRKVCVHGFIGKLANGTIAYIETLPDDICCWGVGGGSKGSFNYAPAKLQFEICEDNLSDANYFSEAFKVAIEKCAEICKKYNLPVSSITSHKESAQQGYGSNHGDPENWMSKHGKDMRWFRGEVEKLLNAEKPAETPAEKPTQPTGDVLYRVQVGAFTVKSNAEALKNKLTDKKINAIIITDGSLHKVQVGAFKIKANATNYLNTLKMQGINGYIVESKTESAQIIKIGDKIRLQKNAPIYGKNTTFADWVYLSTLYVREISGDRVVVSINKTGAITGAVNIKNIIKI